MKCFPESGSLLGVDDALARVVAAIAPHGRTETVAISNAADRIAAHDLPALIDLPRYDNSAMDGYAFYHGDALQDGQTSLPVGQRIIAGAHPPALPRGHAAQIFTGATLPAGANTVVMQEDVQRNDDHIVVTGPCAPGQFVRKRGEDLRAGACAVAAGTRLTAAHVALLAASGHGEVQVCARPRIALLATGNELASPGSPLRDGQIYDANTTMLAALCQRAGAEVVGTSTIPDNAAATVAALREWAGRCDLIVTSGGASVGGEDHLKAALRDCGNVALWRIALKPGKPLVFGHVGQTPILGLPGNPVSAFVTFALFGRAAIDRIQTGIATSPKTVWLPAGFTWSKTGPRREYARARIERDATSALSHVTLFPDQNSHIISSLTWADGLAIIPEHTTLRAGDPVEFLPLLGMA